MADFCKQCSIELFGEDSRDLANLGGDVKLTKQELAEDKGWPALCEGCGMTIVNDTGECLSKHCLRKHN